MNFDLFLQFHQRLDMEFGDFLRPGGRNIQEQVSIRISDALIKREQFFHGTRLFIGGPKPKSTDLVAVFIPDTVFRAIIGLRRLACDS